jgi:hypothetical protein
VTSSRWKPKKRKNRHAGAAAPSALTKYAIAPSALVGEEMHIAMGGVGVPDGPGQYVAVALLSKPSRVVRPEYDHHSVDFLGGDSHLAIAAPALDALNAGVPEDNTVKFASTNGGTTIEFEMLPNKHGYAERIRTKPFTAQNLDDAHALAYRVIVGVVSDIALQTDLPLHIDQFETKDVSTGGVKMTVENPYLSTCLDLNQQRHLEPQLRHFSAIYREAVLSNSQNYRFLCFFRIVEGLEKLWNLKVNEAVAKGEARPTRPTWRLPKDPAQFQPHLDAVFPQRKWHPTMDMPAVFPVRGAVASSPTSSRRSLEPIRNDIAHALLQSGTGEGVGLSIDDPAQMLRVQQGLGLLRFITRRKLRDAFPHAFAAYPKDPAP